MIPVLEDMPKDSFVWRVYFAYLSEGMALLGEAVPAEAIEQAAIDAGMATVPLRALDEITLKLADDALHASMHSDHDHGHDHGHDDHSHHHHHHGPTDLMPESAVYVLEKMAHGFNRMGRTSGGGFYDYFDDGDDPELWDGLSVFGRGSNKAPASDARERLMTIQCIQALSCLAESGSITSAAANEASLKEFGFPAPGVIGFINDTGTRALADQANQLAARYGSRFNAPALLTELADANAPVNLA